jgi:uncharacterized membrane protein YeaQ/YmgE (transglycosylase-associated protein family)
VLGAIIQVLLSGFIIGGLARWAVPGPDPMSVPMTILLGVFGSFLGGGIAAAFVGTDQTSGDVFAILIGSILASIVILVRRGSGRTSAPCSAAGALESRADDSSSAGLSRERPAPAREAPLCG